MSDGARRIFDTYRTLIEAERVMQQEFWRTIANDFQTRIGDFELSIALQLEQFLRIASTQQQSSLDIVRDLVRSHDRWQQEQSEWCKNLEARLNEQASRIAEIEAIIAQHADLGAWRESVDGLMGELRERVVGDGEDGDA